MKYWTVTLAVLLMLGSTGLDLLACGEKFLVPVRGTRFSAAPPKRADAAILLYADAASPLSRTLARLSAAKTLRKASYRVTEVGTDPQLAVALKQHWDLVVVDFSDLDVITTGARFPASALLPVSYTLTGGELKSARRQYPFILKAPTRVGTLLDAVDAALQEQRDRPAGTPNP